MAKAMWTLILAVSVVVVAFAPPQTEADISCNTVQTDLMPCLNYAMNGGEPPANCCNGVRSLYNQARTTPDRQAVCNCLKGVASSATPTILNNAAALPRKCGVSIPYAISPSTNCNTIR